MRLWYHGNMKDRTGKRKSSLFFISFFLGIIIWRVPSWAVHVYKSARMALRSRPWLLRCWALLGRLGRQLASFSRRGEGAVKSARESFILHLFLFPKNNSQSWVIYCDLLPNVDLVCVGHRSLFRNDGFNVKGKGATGCFGTIVFSTATRAVHSRSFYF
jgi:hypothetical protein